VVGDRMKTREDFNSITIDLAGQQKAAWQSNYPNLLI
jgi:hypothetical protein